MTTTTNSTMSGGADNGVHLGKLALVFIVFAALFLITALVMDVSVYSIQQDVRANQRVGPVVTTTPNTILYVSVENRSLSESWAYVEAELVDRRGRWAGGFGGNQYHESGYDSDGYWSESESTVDLTLVVPDPGEYWLRFKVEGGKANSNRASNIASQTQLSVTVDYKLGGAGIFFVIGLIVLVMGVILNEIRNRTIMRLIF